MATGYGIKPRSSELGLMLTDVGGRQTRGLQNRLRGAVEASWVGSIPIHPRQICRLYSQVDSQSAGRRRSARTWADARIGRIGDLDSRESITFVTVLYEHMTALIDRPTKNAVHLNALTDDLAASPAETVSKAS